VPERRRTISPNYSGPHYSNFDVEVELSSRFTVEIIKNVQIFAFSHSPCQNPSPT